MARCPSIYQNRNPQGEPLGPPIRCTREAGHPESVEQFSNPDMHHWRRPGWHTRWPESAAEPAKEAVMGTKKKGWTREVVTVPLSRDNDLELWHGKVRTGTVETDERRRIYISSLSMENEIEMTPDEADALALQLTELAAESRRK